MIMTDEEKVFIESMDRYIENQSVKELLDCLISALELRQERLEEETKEYKDLHMLHGTLEAVSHAAECVAAISIVSEVFESQLERNARRRILAEMLLNIAEVKLL